MTFSMSMSLLGAWAGTAVPPKGRSHSAPVGASAAALKLPESAFYAQVSRGWQFVSAPLTASGERGLLAVSDGRYWNFELRAMVRRGVGAFDGINRIYRMERRRGNAILHPLHTADAVKKRFRRPVNPVHPVKEIRTSPLVGFVFHYQDPGSYGALLWNTQTGALTLRELRQDRATSAVRKIASFGSRPWASLVLRVVMGDLGCYVNGEKILTASEPSLLGRVAVFAMGDTAQLDGLEVRPLRPQESDVDVFGRSRAAYETKCAACHELVGPWNSRYAPDDWESVVNEMLSNEGADKLITRAEADRIIDYLRLISLAPDPNRYRPREQVKR